MMRFKQKLDLASRTPEPLLQLLVEDVFGGTRLEAKAAPGFILDS